MSGWPRPAEEDAQKLVEPWPKTRWEDPHGVVLASSSLVGFVVVEKEKAPP